jgi:putative inorganic carbon (hco3(-)) transporter
MRDLAVIFTWMMLIPVAFIRAYVGVLLWAWTAFIAPNAYTYGIAQGISYNKIITGVTVLATLISNEKKQIHWDATLILLFVFLAHGTVSYLLSGNNSAAFDIFDKFWKECALCFFINLLITDRLRLHSLLATCAIGLGFHGVVEGLKVVASGGGHHVLGLPTLGDNNQFAVALLMIIPVLNYLSRQSRNWIVKYAWMAGMGLNVLGVVGTWSRGGFIGLAVLGIGMVVLTKRKIRSLAIVGSVAFVVMGVASQAYFDRLSTIEGAEGDSSFMGRVFVWRISLVIAQDHPIFGVGFHGVQDPGIFHYYATKVEIPEEYKNNLPIAKAAHSIYFEVLGDLGFVGLGLFLALIALSFYNVGRAARFAKGKPDLQWIYELAHMLRLTLIAYCVSGAGVSMGYFEFFYVNITVIAIVRRFCTEMQAESAGVAVKPAGGPLIADSMPRPLTAQHRF